MPPGPVVPVATTSPFGSVSVTVTPLPSPVCAVTVPETSRVSDANQVW